MVHPSSVVDEARARDFNPQSSSNEEKGDRWSVGKLRGLTEEVGFRRGKKGRTRSDPIIDPADLGGQRTQAKKPTARHLVCAGGSRVVGVIVDASSFGRAMVDHVRMSDAVDRV
jgi:hypothetical protein